MKAGKNFLAFVDFGLEKHRLCMVNCYICLQIA